MKQIAVKQDLTMEAHEAIRAAILSGELAPLTPIGQEEMAERLGVSRQPVSRATRAPPAPSGGSSIPHAPALSATADNSPRILTCSERIPCLA